jgi:predicted nucleic acid-binding protein
MILIDASGLVALVVRNDPRHTASVDALKDVTEPLGTVWPAVARAMEVLASLPKAQDAVWEMIDRGAPRLVALDETDLARIRELMQKSRLDIAAASLVRVSERDGVRKLFTAEPQSYAGRKLKLIP